MIDPKTDLLPIRDWKLDSWNLQSYELVLKHGTEEQKDYILDWSYSGVSSSLSERFYNWAGRKYPYDTNHEIPYPVSC